MTCLNCGKYAFQGAFCQQCRDKNYNACRQQTEEAMRLIVHKKSEKKERTNGMVLDDCDNFNSMLNR